MRSCPRLTNLSFTLVLTAVALCAVSCGGAEATSDPGAQGAQGGSSVGGVGVAGTSHVGAGGIPATGGATGTNRGGGAGVGGTVVDNCLALGIGCAAGGSTSIATTGVCIDPDATTPSPYKVASTTTGLNGSFSDTCDASGNLVEQYCEMTSVACPYGPLPTGPAPAIASANPAPSAGVAIMMPVPTCQQQQTGNVLSTTVDCGGKCNAGKCFQWCPSQGDILDATAVSAQLVSMRFNGYNLSCKVVFTQPGYDCLMPSIAGIKLAAVSFGNCSGTTTVFGTDLPTSGGAQACTYECTVN